MTNWKTPSRFMAGLITLILLGLFAYVLLSPAIFGKQVEFDATLVQTLITLTVLAVSFYISSTNTSQAKDETIAAQAKAAAPTPPTGPLTAGTPTGKIDDPVAVVPVPPQP